MDIQLREPQRWRDLCVGAITAGVIGWIVLWGWCWIDLSANRFFERGPAPWCYGPQLPTLSETLSPDMQTVFQPLLDLNEQFQTFDDHGSQMRVAIAYFGLSLCTIAVIACFARAVNSTRLARARAMLGWISLGCVFIGAAGITPVVADRVLCRIIEREAEIFERAAVVLRDHQLTPPDERDEWLFLEKLGYVKHLTHKEGTSFYSPRGYAGATRLTLSYPCHATQEGEIVFGFGNALTPMVVAIARQERDERELAAQEYGEPFYEGIRFSLWIVRAT